NARAPSQFFWKARIRLPLAGERLCWAEKKTTERGRWLALRAYRSLRAGFSRLLGVCHQL
ncbi:MAG TPA: hypothetical protein PK867_13870, partial [Pirellulales bacterium]|nr:hypothetical protein [Pirellulales bacterium]